jgi:hypothetical protein
MLKTLTHTELAWARDAFETIFPGPQGIGAMDVEGYLTSTFAKIPLEPALGLRVAIWIVALSPLFVLGRFSTFHALGPSDREKVMSSLAVHRTYFVRQLVLALKAIGALLYAGDPRVSAQMFAPKARTLLIRKKTTAIGPTVEAPAVTKEGARVA